VLDGLSRPPLRVYEVKDPLPRVRFVTRARPPAHPDDPVASLSDPGFDPTREVLLDGVPASAPADDRDLSSGGNAAPGAGTVAPGADAPRSPACRVLQDDPERVRIEVDAEAPGYVVLADAWAPGWRARVDGRDEPILKADVLFRAIEVGAGRHEVDMRYRPRSVVLGLGVSVLGAALTAAWARRRGDRVA